MALIQCTECKKEISKSADKCPNCGHPNPKAKHLPGGQVFGILLLVVGFIWWQFGGGMTTQVESQMQKLKDKVAIDAVSQYQIAKREGDKMQICVQAGMVSATYLQAKDESNYQKAKQVEKDDCARAGINF